MDQRVCSYEGCGKKYHSRGYCQGHAVLDRRGEPLRPLRSRRTEKVPRTATRFEHLMADVRKDKDCWVWLGYVDAGGSGRISHETKVENVQTVAYEEQIGPVEEGSVVRSTCDNRLCVRKEHLTLVNRLVARRTPASGYHNVYPSKSGWFVRVGADGDYVYGGSYSTVEDANEAAVALRKKLGIVADLAL